MPNPAPAWVYPGAPVLRLSDQTVLLIEAYTANGTNHLVELYDPTNGSEPGIEVRLESLLSGFISLEAHPDPIERHFYAWVFRSFIGTGSTPGAVCRVLPGENFYDVWAVAFEHAARLPAAHVYRSQYGIRIDSETFPPIEMIPLPYAHNERLVQNTFLAEAQSGTVYLNPTQFGFLAVISRYDVGGQTRVDFVSNLQTVDLTSEEWRWLCDAAEAHFDGFGYPAPRTNNWLPLQPPNLLLDPPRQISYPTHPTTALTSALVENPGQAVELVTFPSYLVLEFDFPRVHALGSTEPVPILFHEYVGNGPPRHEVVATSRSIVGLDANRVVWRPAPPMRLNVATYLIPIPQGQIARHSTSGYPYARGQLWMLHDQEVQLGYFGIIRTPSETGGDLMIVSNLALDVSDVGPMLERAGLVSTGNELDGDGTTDLGFGGMTPVVIQTVDHWNGIALDQIIEFTGLTLEQQDPCLLFVRTIVNAGTTTDLIVATGQDAAMLPSHIHVQESMYRNMTLNAEYRREMPDRPDGRSYARGQFWSTQTGPESVVMFGIVHVEVDGMATIVTFKASRYQDTNGALLEQAQLVSTGHELMSSSPTLGSWHGVAQERAIPYRLQDLDGLSLEPSTEYLIFVRTVHEQGRMYDLIHATGQNGAELDPDYLDPITSGEEISLSRSYTVHFSAGQPRRYARGQLWAGPGGSYFGVSAVVVMNDGVTMAVTFECNQGNNIGDYEMRALIGGAIVITDGHELEHVPSRQPEVLRPLTTRRLVGFSRPEKVAEQMRLPTVYERLMEE